jgi:hypothetical protein
MQLPEKRLVCGRTDSEEDVSNTVSTRVHSSSESKRDWAHPQHPKPLTKAALKRHFIQFFILFKKIFIFRFDRLSKSLFSSQEDCVQTKACS